MMDTDFSGERAGDVSVSSPEHKRLIEGAIAGLVALIVLVYWPGMHAKFAWDDLPSIVDNPSIRSWSWKTLFGGTGTAMGRPVLNVSLALNYAIGGLNVYGYHLVNLGIHVVTTLILFGVLRRTFRLRGVGFGDELSLLIVGLWGLHPILTPAVTMTIQRAEILVGMFYLLTLYCFIRGVTESRRWLVGAVGACALGMGTKELMVTAPFMVLLYDLIFLPPRTGRWKAHAGLWLTCLILVPLVSTRGGTAGYGLGLSMWQYLRMQPWIVCRYLWFCFVPQEPRFSPSWMEIPQIVSGSEFLTAWIIASVSLAVILWGMWRCPAVSYWGIWVAVILSPSSSIVPIVSEYGAERRMYLPGIGVAVLVGLGLWGVISRFKISDAGKRGVMIGVCALIMGALSVQTWTRNSGYEQAPGGMTEIPATSS